MGFKAEINMDGVKSKRRFFQLKNLVLKKMVLHQNYSHDINCPVLFNSTKQQ